MTQKRKAELQRKLSMAPVAKPPTGLAERIKGAIPEHLSVRRDRERFTHSIAFSLRVAASIILLIASAYLTIDLLSRGDATSVTDITARSPVADSRPTGADVSEQQELLTATTEAAPAADAQLAMAKTSASSGVDAAEPAAQRTERRRERAPSRAPAAPQVAQRDSVADTNQMGDRQERGVEGPTAGVVGGVMGGVVAQTAEAPPAAPEPAAAPPPPPPAVYEALTIDRRPPQRAVESARVMPTASARLQESSSPFGISVDPSAFARVREMIERAEEPRPSDIDVSAIANHFAGRPERARSGVRLEVEASRSPLGSDDAAIIRYAIDSGLATRASLTIHRAADGPLDSHAPFAGGDLSRNADATVMRDQSITALFKVRLTRGAHPDDRVATALLTWTTADGRPETATEVLRVRDFDRSWPASSLRHRRATLAAVWAEALRTGAPAERLEEIARKAADLAAANPRDELARELAEVATASSRLRTSGRTGSER